jgi:hypothetical protein
LPRTEVGVAQRDAKRHLHISDAAIVIVGEGIGAIAVVRGRQLAGIGVGAQLRIDDRARRIVPDMLRLPIRAVIGDDDAAAIRGNGQGEVAIGVIGLQRGAAGRRDGLRDLAIGIERHRGGIAIGIDDGGAIARVVLREEKGSCHHFVSCDGNRLTRHTNNHDIL